MNKLKYLLTVIVVLTSAIVIYKNQEIANGIKKGIIICTESVIPSLFVFTVISVFMVGAELLSDNPVAGFLSKLLFGLKGDIGAASLLSLICGYPVGGTLINELYLNHKIDKENAQKMICYCINAGPAFVIGIIGNKLYNNSEIGIIILASSILSTIICGRFIMIHFPKNQAYKIYHTKINYTSAFIRAVNVSTKNMAMICGWVLMSSAIIEIISQSKATKTLACFLEVISGTALAAQNYSIFLVAFLVGFGGISVHLQAMSAAKDILPSFHKILFWKSLQGLLTTFISYILLKIFPQDIQVSNGIDAIYPTADGNAFAAIVTIIFIMCTILFTHQKLKNARKL